MSRGKNCRETIFAAQLPRNYPHLGGNIECGGEAVWEAVWEAFYETIWARVNESQKLPRDNGSQFLPRGIKMSRRALWAVLRPFGPPGPGGAGNQFRTSFGLLRIRAALPSE